tara:strand:+ start:82 stop:672 length:591 start_codon:yes stop_codon:yes gene_type:complete
MAIIGNDFPSRIMGSAFVDIATSKVTPPTGLSIIAIQFLANTTLAQLQAVDSTTTINIGSAANSTGDYTRTVNQTGSTTNKVIFDQENFVSNTDQIEVGDIVFDGATGAEHATVTALNPDGDNTKEIQISASVALTEDETLVFKKPNQVYGRAGAGGVAVDDGNIFPGGMTIHGRWNMVLMRAADADGGMIVYFGE